MSDQPAPFEIVTAENGLRVASNGAMRMQLTETDGRLFKRRGIKGLATTAAGEALLPLLNQFAGDLVSQPDMPAETVLARMNALAGTVNVAKPQHIEWAVAELHGVRVYFDGVDVVVTRRDLAP